MVSVNPSLHYLHVTHSVEAWPEQPIKLRMLDCNAEIEAFSLFSFFWNELYMKVGLKWLQGFNHPREDKINTQKKADSIKS